jgi:hypothetical protein
MGPSPDGSVLRVAREHESLSVVPLLDALDARGFAPETAALDRGYDLRFVYEACADRVIAPIIPLRETGNVKGGHHRPPECEHGTGTFAGADFKRRRAKWRCPSGECSPGSVWIKADRLQPLIPRGSRRFRQPLPRTCRRGARVRPLEARVGIGPSPASGAWRRFSSTPTSSCSLGSLRRSLELRPARPAAAWKEVHQRDQGDDGHHGDSDDGNGAHGQHQALRFFSDGLCAKPTPRAVPLAA